MESLNKEHKKLFDKLVLHRNRIYETLQEPCLAGINQTTVNKYADSAHFLLEFLQNADDAEATEIVINFNDQVFDFQHNGKIRFSISDSDNEETDSKTGSLGHINAITSIGNTSKTNARNKIGKFGLGFKSVFQYCDEPEIHDYPFAFKISNLIVPVEINNVLDKNSDKTLFRLHFKNNDRERIRRNILDKFKELPNNILFLNNIEEIEWTIDNVRTNKITKIEKECHSHSKVLVNYKNEAGNTVKNEYLKFTAAIFKSKRNAAIMFPLDQGVLVAKEGYSPYCYFPLIGEPSLFQFIIQAPFLLNDSREKINFSTKKFETWNKKLINILADLFVRSLDTLKALKLLQLETFNVFPIHKVDYAQYKPIFERFVDSLNKNEFIPTDTGGFAKVNELGIARPKELATLFDSNDLKKMFPNYEKLVWVDTNIGKDAESTKEIWNFFTNNLHIGVYRPEKIIPLLSNLQLQMKSNNWLKSLYIFLSEYLKHIKDSDFLKTCYFIKLNTNELVPPFDANNRANCYLPSEYGNDYPVVNPEFMLDEKCVEFFKAIGIKEFDIAEDVLKKVLPKYEKKFNIKPEENYKDHVKIFKALSNNTLNSIAIIDKIKNLSIFYDKNNVLKRPNELYVDENQTIKEFFNNIKKIDKVSFLHKDYLKIYKSTDYYLKQMGIITELDLVNEVETKILKDYLYSDNKSLDDKMIRVHLRYILEILENPHMSSYIILNIINKTKFRCKNTSGSISWKNDANTYIKTDEMVVLTEGIDSFNFLDEIYNDNLERLKKFYTFNTKLQIKYRKEFEINGKEKKVFDPDAQIQDLDKILKKMNIEKFEILWEWISPYYFLIDGKVDNNSKNKVTIPITSSYLGKVLKNSEWLPIDACFVQPRGTDLHKIKGKFDKYTDSSKKFADKLGIIGKGISELEAMNVLCLDPNVLEFVRKSTNLPQGKREKFLKELDEVYTRILQESTYEQQNPFDIIRRGKQITGEYEEEQGIEAKPKIIIKRTSNPNLDPKTYLSSKYTFNEKVHCQICEKTMPFKNKLLDYFEVVSLFNGNKILTKESHIPNLALCPICAAKYSIFKKEELNQIRLADLIVSTNCEENKVTYVWLDKLIQNISPKIESIMFEQKHLFDIQTILKAEIRKKQINEN